MRISLGTICDALRGELGYASIQGDERFTVESYCVMRDNEDDFDDSILYIDARDSLGNAGKRPRVARLAFGQPRARGSMPLVIVSAEAEVTDVLDVLTRLFFRFQSWERKTLAAIASNKDLADILNLCASVTKDTVYVTDPSLKIIAHTSPTLMDDVSAIWNFQMKHGYMPMHIVRSLIDTGELDVLNTRKDAFTYPGSCFNLPYICKNIFHGEILDAHLFVVNIYSQPTNANMDIAEALGTALHAFFASHPNLLASYNSFHESFLSDVMEGNLSDVATVQSQLVYFSWDYNDRYQLAIIAPDESSMIGDRALAERLESEVGLDCAVFRHKNTMIMLVHEAQPEKLQQLLRRLAKRNRFIASLSKQFSPLSEMSNYFSQTLRVLDDAARLGNEDRLLLDEKFGLRAILSSLLDQHSVFELCHPGVLQLYAADERTGSQLVETLGAYLDNDRNVLKTSKVLFVHRNTLLRRLDKISEFVDVSTCSDEERHYVLFSLDVLHRHLGR